MFSIISTLKSRGKTINKEFSAVPESWINLNYVFWPKTNLTTLLADPYSQPDKKTWTKMKCCVHKKDIASHDEALMWEDKYTEVDTEDEYNLNKSSMVIKTFNGKVELLNDDNEACGYDQMFTDCIIEMPASPFVSNNITEQPILEAIVEPVDEARQEVQRCDCTEFHKTIEKSINRLSSEMVSFRIVLERIEKNLKNPNTLEQNNLIEVFELDKAMNSKFIFPIENTDELKKFNDELVKNREFKKYLVERFGKICGREGNEKASDKISVKLASEILFTKQLLTEISWTGISRTAHVKQKLPFRIMNGILDLIEEIMQNSDSRWNRTDTEKLFRDKLLKHSKQRNMALLKKANSVPEVPEVVIEEYLNTEISNGIEVLQSYTITPTDSLNN